MVAELTELKPTRPVLKYHGSKWLLADWILSHFPPHRVYVEPFCGAASVLLRKPRAEAEIINDLNNSLVNLFAVLRDKAQRAELIEALRLTPYAYTEFVRSIEPVTDAVERARRLVVSSFMGIGSDSSTRGSNGGFRNYSRVGKIGTIPARQWPGFIENMWAVATRLEGVIIECRDALHIIRQHDSLDTLFYLDPPYTHSSRSKGRGRYAFEMSDDEHRALAAELKRCAGMVVLSGYASALYDEELYAGWHRVGREALAANARPRTEVLWINESAWEAKQNTMPLFAPTSSHNTPETT